MSPSRETCTHRCVILRTRPLREADLLVTFLSEREGKLVGVAPHARRSRRRFGGGLEPGIIGEITYTQHPERELVGLEDLRVTSGLPAGVHELPIFASLGVMLSIVEHTSMERQAAPVKFQLVTQVIAALAHHAPPQVVAYFLGQWLREAGFAPSMEQCACCGRAVSVLEPALFAPVDGGLRCHDCGSAHGWSMPLTAPARQYWLQCAAADQPMDQTITPEIRPLYQTGMWQYLCHVLGRSLPAAPYWEMVWT